ncbi:MAG: PKD domain-containing protein [Rhodothermales bacterium]
MKFRILFSCVRPEWQGMLNPLRLLFVMIIGAICIWPITVAAQSDTEVPIVVEFSLDGTQIDVQEGEASLSYSLRVTDNLSGVTEGTATVQVWVTSPSGQRHNMVAPFSSGTALDARFAGQIILPEYSEAGTWTIRIAMRDQAGNFVVVESNELALQGLPSTIEVLSVSDAELPTLIELEVGSDTLNVFYGEASTTYSLRVTDNLSGVTEGTATVQVWVTSPSGQRHNMVAQFYSGTPLDAHFTGQIVLPAYSEAGTWTIRIAMRDQAGNFVVVESSELALQGLQSTIDVLYLETRPVASFTVLPEGGQAPLEVSFDATSSSDPNGDVLAYSWDFGDGQTDTRSSTVHTYTDAGSYVVTLTVSDGVMSDSATQEIIVSSPNVAPIAAFTASPIGGTAPLEVTFDGSPSSDPNSDDLTYAWDYGDGQTGSGSSTVNTFTQAGSYTVRLTVSDGVMSDSATQEIVISEANVAPMAVFSVSVTSGQAPLEVSFDATSSTDPDGDSLSFSWDFGDGMFDVGVVVTHSYTEAGVYTAVLTVSDELLQSVHEVEIDVASGVSTEDNSLPTHLVFESAFPNPFTQDLSVRLLVPTVQNVVTLRVFDMLGREIVRKIVSPQLGANVIRLQEVSSKVPGGAFVVTVSQGQESQSMLIVHSGLR